MLGNFLIYIYGISLINKSLLIFLKNRVKRNGKNPEKTMKKGKLLIS